MALERESLLPDFELTDLHGERVSTTGVLQRRELLLLLLHSLECPECLTLAQRLSARQREVSALNATVLAVLRQPDRGGPELAFPLLADEEGRVSRSVLHSLELPEEDAFAVVTDRFGRVYRRRRIHGADPDDLVNDALEWIDFVQLQCPECGAPVW